MNPLAFNQNAIVSGWFNVFESLILAFFCYRLARLKGCLIKAPFTGHKPYLRAERLLYDGLCAWQLYSAFQTYAMDAAVATHTRLWLRFLTKLPLVAIVIWTSVVVARGEADMIRTLRASEVGYEEQKKDRISLRQMDRWLEKTTGRTIRSVLDRLKGGDRAASRATVGRP